MIIRKTMRAALLAAVCLLNGCLGRPPLEEQSFLFAPPSKPEPKVDPGGRVLGLRTLQIAAPFNSRAFVYRTGDLSYEADPYAGFMVPPADELVSPVCSDLRAAGVFRSVEEAGSALKPDTLVEIYVSELYGDFRPAQNASAVLAMRFDFFDAPRGLPGKALLQREYARTIPLKAKTAAALMEGWNQGLAQILDAAVLDFRQSAEITSKP